MGKIIVRMKGGLGNQLFCYSAALRLAVTNNAELVVDDVSGFVRDKQYRRRYMLDSFNVSARKATPAERLEPFERYRRGIKKVTSNLLSLERRSYVTQVKQSFDERILHLKVNGTIYFDGLWQSEQYFKDIESEVRSQFAVIPPEDPNNIELADRINNVNSVCLHVRWFDQANEVSEHNVSSYYYEQAIAFFEQKENSPHYFLFSDDPSSILSKVALPPGRFTIVNHNDGDENASSDFWLMTQCRHFIIANSTFSWWAAWLGAAPGKTVVAPSLRVTGKTAWGFDGLIPGDWITLPCTKGPEVTVLMSCFNASRWLKEAIESVLGQTFADFEFILIDDGSQDDTWDVIQEYAASDTRVVAIKKPNTGLADSLNLGIKNAKGRWIARIDADDICEPRRLQEQVAYVQEHPDVVLVGSGFVEIDENGNRIMEHFYPSNHDDLVKHLKTLRRFFPHSSAFYSTNYAKKLGGYCPRIRKAEDWQMWLELCRFGRIACLARPLVRIRKHAEQISHENLGQRQLLDATAATVSHFLLAAGESDIVRSSDDNKWTEFLNWIENSAHFTRYFARRRAWSEARASLLDGNKGLRTITKTLLWLCLSGHAAHLFFERFYGTALPRRLARQWRSLEKIFG